MTDLSLKSLRKAYGNVVALDSIDLTVERGEFLTLLGPSGCGKSTTLAAIAGLDIPTAGSVRFRDAVLYDGDKGIFLPPERRNFGVVFQSYALWPHLSVERNVAMPLELRRVPAAERRKRVAETLDLVGLSGFAQRYPGELSGGQQQRVALARAIVFKPPLLLLDEPLSNLDAQLRLQARSWLKNIQRELGLTTIYVTHDQEEALAMSDRIVVMRGGQIMQIGTPTEVYEQPRHAFAARFVGSANLIGGTAMPADGSGDVVVTLADGQKLRGHAPAPFDAAKPVVIVMRPERLQTSPLAGANEVVVEFGAQSYLGERYEQEIRVAGETLRLRGHAAGTAGKASVWVAPQDVLVFAQD
jgi:iron(III) transport system ATP-binding protein